MSAAFHAKLIDLKAKAAALRFCSQQDALDYAAHAVKDANRSFAALNISAFDRYLNGDVGCYVRLKSLKSRSATAEQYDLIFFRVPSDIAETCNHHKCALDGLNLTTERGGGVANCGRNEDAVFLGITELIHGPKGIIPSFVWIEAPKQREDFRRQMRTNTTARNFLVENGRIDPPCESDLVCLFEGVGLWINHVGPWFVFDESVNLRFQVINVMMCASQGQSRAIERFFSHGQAELEANMSDTEATQQSDVCEKHKTPMIKEREHIGSGNWQWSVPYCPLCRELEAKAAAQPSAG